MAPTGSDSLPRPKPGFFQVRGEAGRLQKSLPEAGLGHVTGATQASRRGWAVAYLTQEAAAPGRVLRRPVHGQAGGDKGQSLCLSQVPTPSWASVPSAPASRRPLVAQLKSFTPAILHSHSLGPATCYCPEWSGGLHSPWQGLRRARGQGPPQMKPQYPGPHSPDSRKGE